MMRPDDLRRGLRRLPPLVVATVTLGAGTLAGCASTPTESATPSQSGSTAPPVSVTLAREASVKDTSVTLTNNTGSPLSIAWSRGIGDEFSSPVVVANGSSTSAVDGGQSDAQYLVFSFTASDDSLLAVDVGNPSIGYPFVRTCPDKANGAPADYTCMKDGHFSPKSNFSEGEEKTLDLSNYDNEKLYTATVKRENDTDTNKVWTITLT